MLDSGELERAAKDAEKAKKLVLRMLHWNGIIAFDASQLVLDPEVEAVIKGEG